MSQQLKRLGLPVMIIAVAVCHMAYLFVATEGWIVDDAYITFRYVDHWVAGHGLVFNVGERVEGYTNFLWILLLTPLRAAGLPLPETARLLGVGLTLGAIVLLYRIGGHQLGRRLGWLPAALYALNHSLMTWSFGGLELPLFLFLLLLGTHLLFVRQTSWALAAFALLALTRPEGYLFLLLAVPAARHLFAPAAAGARRWAPAWVAVALVLGHGVFKLTYYGALLPNTFHAKVGFGLSQVPRGYDYLSAAFARYGALLPASVLLAFVRRDRPWRRYLLSCLVLYAAYVTYTGGDPLPGYRLALPLLPLGWLGVLTVVRRLPQRPRWATVAVALLLLGNDVSEGLPGTRKGKAFRHFKNDKVAECGGFIGRWFDRVAAPNTTIATNTAGSIPYFAPRQRVIDMLGLTDATIARGGRRMGRGYVGHEKYDAQYVLSRKPDYILLCFSCATAKPCLPSCRALAEEPEFKANYQRQLAQQEGFRFYYYARRDGPRRRRRGP